MCYVRSYLRASTSEQDASRARDQVQAFAAERGLTIVSWYVENESGAKLDRPELRRLLDDACDGDILLIEQVDRLSRLTAKDWEALKAQLAANPRLADETVDLTNEPGTSDPDDTVSLTKPSGMWGRLAGAVRGWTRG